MKKLILSLFFISISASAADIVNSLPKNNEFGKVARRIGTRLADNNISTGITSLWAGQLKYQGEYDDFEDYNNLVLDGFKKSYKKHIGADAPADTNLKAYSEYFIDGETRSSTAYKMTTAVMESNDFTNNKENRESQARLLWVVLRKMPVSKTTQVGHVTTTLNDDVTGEKKRVQYFLLLNEKEKTVLQLFTIEGSM